MKLSALRIPRARLIVAAAGVIAAIAILWLSRAYTFYFDEWDFIQSAPGWGWASYLQPHNEHPTILPHLVYAALLNTVGLRSYLPYMLVLVALHVTTALLLFELVRRRAGDAIGMAAALMLLVLGAGWEDLLWAFQITFVGSVACGLGLLLALEDPPSNRRRSAAALLATASIMFSAIGLFFLAAAAVRLALAPSRRRDVLWLVPVVVAFAAWYLAFGHSGTATVPPAGPKNLPALPLYVIWGLAGGAGGVIGVTGVPALAVLVLAAAAVVFDWRLQAPDSLDLGVAAGLLTFYVVTGLGRAQLGYEQAASGRYVYIGAVFWLVLLSGPARRLPWRKTWRPALAACLFLACFNSSVLLVAYGAAKAQLMQREIADLQALASERTGACLGPSGVADRLVMPQVTDPAAYYRAVDRFGDPAGGRPITDHGDFDAARANLSCATP
jgi:hypothetical protein